MTIPVLLIVSFMVFSVLYLLPGDPVELMLAEVGADKATMEQLRESLGLNDPFYVQYGRFLFNAIRGDFGRSIRSNRPVMETIASQLPATLELALSAMTFAVIAGVLMGTVAALRQNTWVDNLVMGLSVIGVSMPIFWQGLLLIFLFSLRLGWLPATGQGGGIRLILPAFTLGTGAIGTIARLTRSSVLEIMRQEYIVTARAKGLRERAVIFRHALRNALIPVVTVVGLQFGSLMGGAVITETVFARQGVGHLMVDAIMYKDFPLVQGTVFLVALAYMGMNLLVDLSYAILDPRIRYET
jgi:ABC-type dipeptide/oligopeptide/nickel transport system permease component